MHGKGTLQRDHKRDTQDRETIRHCLSGPGAITRFLRKCKGEAEGARGRCDHSRSGDTHWLLALNTEGRRSRAQECRWPRWMPPEATLDCCCKRVLHSHRRATVASYTDSTLGADHLGGHNHGCARHCSGNPSCPTQQTDPLNVCALMNEGR